MLHLRPATIQETRHACTEWHYSGRIPSFKRWPYAVTEGGRFVGVVVFGIGATPNIASPFGLARPEVVELCRVALDRHQTPTSRIVAIAVRLFRRDRPDVRLIVSFADTAQGHHGGIYQAGGWVYVGAKSYPVYRVLGQTVHPKTLHSRYGIGGQSVPWLRQNVDPEAERVYTPVKHKYVLVLDRTLTVPGLPYPKRAA